MFAVDRRDHLQHDPRGGFRRPRIGREVELAEVVALADVTVLAPDVQVGAELFHDPDEIAGRDVRRQDLEIRELLRQLVRARETRRWRRRA